MISSQELHLLQKGPGHIDVVLEIKPTEPHFSLVLIVDLQPIDNCGDPACQSIVLIGQKEACLGILKDGVYLPVKGFKFILDDRGYPVWGIFIKGKGKFYKFFQLSFCSGLFYGNHTSFFASPIIGNIENS